MILYYIILYSNIATPNFANKIFILRSIFVLQLYYFSTLYLCVRKTKTNTISNLINLILDLTYFTSDTKFSHKFISILKFRVFFFFMYTSCIYFLFVYYLHIVCNFAIISPISWSPFHFVTLKFTATPSMIPSRYKNFIYGIDFISRLVSYFSEIFICFFFFCFFTAAR